jgi:hypothetical protein
MNKRLPAVLALLAMIATLSTVAGAQPVEPLEIDVMLSMTGPASFLGKAEQAAFQTLETQVNARGGINGRPIKLVIADDTSSPQVAVQLANGFIAKKVPVFLGSPLASGCFSFLALVAKAGPVNYCLSPPVKGPPGSFVFVAGASAVDLSTALIRYLRERGITRFAILTTTDATGHDFEDSYLTVLGRPDNKNLTIERDGAVFDDLTERTDLPVVSRHDRRRRASGPDQRRPARFLRGTQDAEPEARCGLGHRLGSDDDRAERVQEARHERNGRANARLYRDAARLSRRERSL